MASSPAWARRSAGACFLVPQLSRITGFVPTALISGAVCGCLALPAAAHHRLQPRGRRGVQPGHVHHHDRIAELCLYLAALALEQRLRSVLLHTSHNVFILHFFAPLTGETPLSPFFTGETGAALMIVSVLLAVLFWRLSRKSCQLPSLLLRLRLHKEYLATFIPF